LGFELFKVTLNPPGPAFPVRYIPNVIGLPPTTVVGAVTIFDMDAGSKVTVCFKVTGPLVAVIVTGVAADTPTEDTGKANALAPAGTSAVAGTVKAELLLLMFTVEPPGPAPPFR
jgi:hypothetical protein